MGEGVLVTIFAVALERVDDEGGADVYGGVVGGDVFFMKAGIEEFIFNA